MSVAVLCAREILPLLDAMAAGNIDGIRDRRAEIDRLEHEADQIKHEIRSHTPKRFMMALDRRTILEILDYQDSIADITQDIAELADHLIHSEGAVGCKNGNSGHVNLPLHFRAFHPMEGL